MSVSVRASEGPRLRADVVRATLYALTYFIGGEAGYALSLGPEVGGTFWPPAGIALAAFLIAPRRAWPLLVAVSFVANLASDILHGQAVSAALGFAAANLTEPLIGAYLIRRFFRGPITFTRFPEVVAMALVVTFVSAPLSAAVGAVAAELWTVDPPGFASSWRTWWIGDAVGALVLTPAVVHLVVRWRWPPRIAGRKWLEGAAYAVAVLAVARVIVEATPSSLAVPFLAFPLLLWGSVRLGPVGVGGALCLIVALTAHSTAAGGGPFVAEHLSLGDRLIALQLYIGVMAVSFHALGVLWGERRRATAALRAAHLGLEARYRRIVEQSPLAILVVDRDGRVQEANPAWRRLRMTSSEAETPLHPWEDRGLGALVERAFQGATVEVPGRELDVQTDDGPERRFVQGFVYPIKDEADHVAEVVLIEQDITDELATQRERDELLEAERVARSEAERASILKDEFLATLSHELRTPLNAIIGWAYILRGASDAPTRVQAVETIERNAHAQASMIEDLLDMSRIMAGKVGLTRVSLRLEEIVSAAVDALRPVAEGKGVTLALNLERDAEVRVAGDAARLQQVVTNLLDNALKFTPAGGRVEVQLKQQSDDALIIVSDTGQGVSQDLLPAIFERFRQADASTTRRHIGLGIGLSIAKQIVELHGGSIAAHSDGLGHGAIFTVTLPALRDVDDPVPDGAALVPVAALDGLRVLVVDDQADARELLRRLLEDTGCQVDTAASADAALALAGKQRYDVLLSDLGMPETDGYALIRRIRAGGYGEPRAIAVTAFARTEDRERAFAAGFDAHLPKPVNPQRLLHALVETGAADRNVQSRDGGSSSAPNGR